MSSGVLIYEMAYEHSHSLHKYFTGPGLISTNGSEHRRQRKLLNPAFSDARIRRLETQMRDISHQLLNAILREIDGDAGKMGTRGCDLDMAEYLGRAALELVAQTGFGHTYHALEGAGDECVRAFKDFVYVD